MEHLTTHLHRPRTTRSPQNERGDGGIVPFEPFFMLFPEVWRKLQSIGFPQSSLPERKNVKFFFLSAGTRRLDLAIRRMLGINNSLLGLRPPQSL
jgi:hypothetical protein